ncbi:MAG: acyloxyacyl hydrolase [Desulfurella sp.]
MKKILLTIGFLFVLNATANARIIYNFGYGFGLLNSGNGFSKLDKKYYDYYKASVDFEHFYTKNFSVIAEPFVAYVNRPTEGVSFGVSGLLRYYFLNETTFRTFADGGLGVSYNTLQYPGQASKYLFMPQVGLGIEFNVGKSTKMFIEDRFIHMSCASIKEPNGAVNSNTIMIGISF